MKRYTSIDLLRGLIMIFMALDHASMMVGRTHFAEFWGVEFAAYPDIFWWGTRFLSHFCAPGFFLLMGISIFLFADKSLAAGWSSARIRNYFFKRGSLILLLMFLLELPAFGIEMMTNQAPSSGGAMPGLYTGGKFFPGTVLYGLGMCMILGALLWRLGKIPLLLITVGSFALSAWYLTQADPAQAFSPWLHLSLVPGMSNGAMILYPIIPWLGVTTFGIFLAQVLGEKPAQFYSLSLKTGFAFLLGFLCIRFLGQGNFQVTEYHDWISFFTLIKYPPSLAFILLTLGVHLILLYLFSKVSGKGIWKPVLIFGQTALFFYILHLYLYALVGLAFRQGSSIVVMYAIWLAGLVLLYFICRRYLAFKKSRPAESFWRML